MRFPSEPLPWLDGAKEYVAYGKAHGDMKPQADMVHTARNIPALEELRARQQWVCWRKEQRRGKPTKIPYNAATGQWAKSDTPATWSDYNQAMQALRPGGYH